MLIIEPGTIGNNLNGTALHAIEYTVNKFKKSKRPAFAIGPSCDVTHPQVTLAAFPRVFSLEKRIEESPAGILTLWRRSTDWDICTSLPD